MKSVMHASFRRIFLRSVLLFCFFAAAPAGCAGQEAGNEADLPLGRRISNCGEIIRGLRRGLRENASEITVSFEYGTDILDELGGAVSEWMELAREETGSPQEGDYLRLRMGGYSYSCRKTESGGRYRYSVAVTPEYYTYRSQELKTDEEVKKIRRELAFRAGDSDEKKIRRIYGWLCENVRYDKVHGKNPNTHLKATAYSALVLRTATCQGYSAALYRLLREEGIECRAVTGQAGGETLHAWILVRLGDRFYLLDPTYDAGQEEWKHYLLGRKESEDHVPEERFRTEEFRTRYPMAEKAYFRK